MEKDPKPQKVAVVAEVREKFESSDAALLTEYRGLSVRDLAELRAAMLVLFQDTRYLTLVLVFGTASTVLGGYLAARLAPSVPYFNALAFGVLGLIVSTLTSGDLPLWFKIVGFAVTLPAALLGGHIAKLQAGKTGS